VDRLTQLQTWLNKLAEDTYEDLRPASADASFRQYFRVTNRQDNKTYIVMDAPPDKEDCHPFVLVTDLIRGVDVNAPDIISIDIEQGFLLLDDLGDDPYLKHLDDTTADGLYTDAIDALVKMQSIDGLLPAYDRELLLTEMKLFETWYVNRHLGIQLDDAQKSALLKVFDLLLENAEQQPQVFVHRDYHSRNLMITNENNPGVIDYQDAVIGPITYDLVSLFKDCYIEWPREKVEHWLDLYLARIAPDRLIEKQQLLRWFDLMGVQRHLKVLGIFARLNYRDGKSQYLDDLPLTRRYILDSCNVYHDLLPLKLLFESIGDVSSTSPEA
jgi:aminoglycoside/choline kinase family phosphotransferase